MLLRMDVDLRVGSFGGRASLDLSKDHRFDIQGDHVDLAVRRAVIPFENTVSQGAEKLDGSALTTATQVGAIVHDRLPGCHQFWRVFGCGLFSAARSGSTGAHLAKLAGFTDSMSEIVELGAAHLAAALGFDTDHIGRMQHEDALNALLSNDTTHGEVLAQAATSASNDHAVKDLKPILVAFYDSGMDIHRVADTDRRNV